MRRGASVTVPRRSATSWLTGGAPSATTVSRTGPRAWAVVLALLALAAAGCTREQAPPRHRLVCDDQDVPLVAPRVNRAFAHRAGTSCGTSWRSPLSSAWRAPGTPYS